MLGQQIILSPIWQNSIRLYIAYMLASPEISLEAAQSSRIRELLPRWRKIPLYREMLARQDFDLRDLPIITKREMRVGFPENFLHSGRTLKGLLAEQLVELEHTSGTSEDRLPVIFGVGWWNEQEKRALRLNKFVARALDETPNARRATLTSPACNGLTCPTVWMSQAQRTLGDALFINLARIPFVLSDAELQRMADEITEWSPQFLDLDPVHGSWFALYCERNNIRFPSLQFTLCSYEFVSVVHRRIIQRVFGVPVFNLYGSTETGHLLMENETGEMKPSYDTAALEILETDAAGIGTLLVTTLSNDYMPLLRYRIGDLSQRREQAYGTDYLVHGRIRDALTSASGNLVTTWQVDQCFVGASGIAHYQLREMREGNFHLRYVPEPNGGVNGLSSVIARLESLLQSTMMTEPVPTLLPEGSGKFRLTCKKVE